MPLPHCRIAWWLSGIVVELSRVTFHEAVVPQPIGPALAQTDAIRIFSASWASLSSTCAKSCASFMVRHGESYQMKISYPILLLGLSVLSYFRLPQQSVTTPEPFTQAPFRLQQWTAGRNMCTHCCIDGRLDKRPSLRFLVILWFLTG